MDNESWLQRWQEGRTGWHHDQPMPLLLQYWPALQVPVDSRVLVALCGKSVDMLWLSRQGLRVVGVELAPIAVAAFLAENELRATVHATPAGLAHEVLDPPGGSIEIINADIFDVGATELGRCTAVYDRATLIALPPAARKRLAGEVYAQLPAAARGLLITLEYPQADMPGPPFSVDQREVHRLFDPHWKVELRERRDIFGTDPGLAERGVSSLHTAVYALTRHSDGRP